MFICTINSFVTLKTKTFYLKKFLIKKRFIRHLSAEGIA